MHRRGRPAQLGFDSREQFDHLERLRHVIVGAELEADDLVDDLSLGRQHDHWRLNPALAKLAQHVEPVHAREHHVEQHEIERLAGSALEPTFAIAARLDQIPFARQPIAKGQHEAWLVFDEEQPLHARDPCASDNAVRPTGSSLAAGRTTVNSLPDPGALRTLMRPPCAWTVRLTRLKPRPAP